MDKLKQRECERFYHALPNAPTVVNATYFPSHNIILMPIPLDEQSPFYYKVLYHEIGHKNMHLGKLDETIPYDDNDYSVVAELVAETVSVLICQELDIISETGHLHERYLRDWKVQLQDKSYVKKVFPVAQRIAEQLLDRKIDQKKDVPLGVRIILGLL
jgi:antirestriction protein ArdC